MTDYDKVVKGIEHHLDGRPTCQGCVYLDVWPCLDAILKDALALLKEQEAQLVLNIGQQISCNSGFCPKCGKMLNTTCNKRYCGDCGQAVKWE